MVVCYAAGMLTMAPFLVAAGTKWARRTDSVGLGTTGSTAHQPTQGEEPASQPLVHSIPLPVSPKSELSPYQRLRELGDDYLNRRGKISAAMDCYRMALEAAKDDEKRISEDEDTWLLAALKKDRNRETGDEGKSS